MKSFSSGGCYADITPKERAIANGQRSFVSFLLLQLSNSFLRILAMPNKAVLLLLYFIIIIIIINTVIYCKILIIDCNNYVNRYSKYSYNTIVYINDLYLWYNNLLFLLIYN